MKFLSRFEPWILSIFRIVFGLLFLQHGFTKFLHLPPTQMSGIPMTTLPGVAGVFELVGGVLLVVGFQTRIVAFILSGVMAVAYFLVHAPQGFYPIVNGGELAVAYCFAFLLLAATGAGPLSVDAMRSRA